MQANRSVIRRVSLACVLAAAGISIILCAPRFRTVRSRHISYQTHRYHVAHIDPGQFSVHVAWKDAVGQPFRTFASLFAAHPNSVFATNAGIFEPGFAPTGLFIEDGRELKPLNTADGIGNFYLKPNGIFVATEVGCGIVTTEEWPVSGKLCCAVQSGPLLLRSGVVQPQLDPKSTNRRTRSAVGLVDSGQVVFVLSTDRVTFYELATMMHDRLGCTDALCLDGEISGFARPGEKANTHDYATFLYVTPR